jgi:hypothetical protein
MPSLRIAAIGESRPGAIFSSGSTLARIEPLPMVAVAAVQAAPANARAATPGRVGRRPESFAEKIIKSNG